MRLAATFLGLLLALPGATLAQEPPAEPPAQEAPAPPAMAAPRPAPVPACPARRPRIRMAVVDHEPVLETGLSMDDLRALTGRPRRATQYHLGLTTSRVEWHSELNASYSRARIARGGVFCAVPADIVLTLVQTEHILRVASEIPAGGCLYNEVLRHERRHVAVNRRTLRVAASRAREAAQAWAARAEGRGATLEEAMQALQAGLRRAIEPSLAAMRAARDESHREIDAVEEYRRLSRICPSDQQLLRERLRDAWVD